MWSFFYKAVFSTNWLKSNKRQISFSALVVLLLALDLGVPMSKTSDVSCLAH